MRGYEYEGKYIRGTEGMNIQGTRYVYQEVRGCMHIRGTSLYKYSGYEGMDIQSTRIYEGGNVFMYILKQKKRNIQIYIYIYIIHKIFVTLILILFISHRGKITRTYKRYI